MIRRLLEATLIPSNRAFALSDALREAALFFQKLGETHRLLVISEAALRREVEQFREANRQRAVDEARNLSCGHGAAARWLLSDGAANFWGCIQCEYDRRGAALAKLNDGHARTFTEIEAEISDALKGRDVK